MTLKKTTYFYFQKSPKMSKNTLLQLLAILFTGFILFVIYSANTGADLVFFRMIKHLPFGDKIGHFGLIGMLTFLVNCAMKARTFSLGKFQLLLGSSVLFVLVTLEEFSQIWLDNRNFDLVDLSANYLGILVASSLVYWIYKK